MGPIFFRYLGNAGPERLSSPKSNYHLNENANALLAQTVGAWLSRHGLPRAEAQGKRAACARQGSR